MSVQVPEQLPEQLWSLLVLLIQYLDSVTTAVYLHLVLSVSQNILYCFVLESEFG